MTARVSIRTRLTGWYAVVLALGLTLFGGALWFALAERLIQGLDARLAQRVDGVRAVIEQESPLRNRADLCTEVFEFTNEIPEGNLMAVSDSAGVMVAGPAVTRLFREIPRSEKPQFQIVRGDHRHYRVLTSSFRLGTENYHVLVAGSREEVAGTLRDLRRLLWLMVPAVLLLASGGGYWLSGRALAPVDEITREARTITLQNLSKRLPIPATGDEIQRLSETWNEVLGRLDASVKRMRQFTADASHELRTPLALMRTTAEIALRRERSLAEYQAALRQILSESENMTELIESLLTLARADGSGLTLQLAPCEVNAVVRDVVRQSRPAAEERELVLKDETAAGELNAPADAFALRRLLLALVDNALKHTPRGGSVTVSATAVDHGVCVAVEDTGEGIPGAALAHIFERFYRVDSARTKGAGTGLGLAIAQAIAKAHGSEIQVESEVGKGSRFSFVLPA
jgi:heavy metal sensor kinase